MIDDKAQDAIMEAYEKTILLKEGSSQAVRKKAMAFMIIYTKQNGSCLDER